MNTFSIYFYILFSLTYFLLFCLLDDFITANTDGQHMCNQRPSHSFSHSLRNTQRAIHLHMHISINVWSTPMLRPSHPSTVHDELLSQLVTCKMKNIKQNAGVTVITPKGSFKQNCFSSIHCILHLKSCIMLLLYCTV